MFKGHIAGVLSLQFSTDIIGVQYTLANVSGRGHKFLAWCMPLSDYSTGGRASAGGGYPVDGFDRRYTTGLPDPF